jgi:hypothetical protein
MKYKLTVILIYSVVLACCSLNGKKDKESVYESEIADWKKSRIER